MYAHAYVPSYRNFQLYYLGAQLLPQEYSLVALRQLLANEQTSHFTPASKVYQQCVI